MALVWQTFGFPLTRHPKLQLQKARASTNSESGPLARRSHKVLGRWDDEGRRRRRRSGAIKWTEEERGKKGCRWRNMKHIVWKWAHRRIACLRLIIPGMRANRASMHLPTDWLSGGSLPLTYPPGHLHWPSQRLYCSPPDHTAVTTISQVRLNIRHSRTRYAVYACVCVCWHTCGCLLRALRRMQPECLRHADWQMRLSGFRVPHNSPLSIYPQGERTLGNGTEAAPVQGEGLRDQWNRIYKRPIC